MTESVKISFLLQPPKEAISKARLPCSIDLGSITGTHLTTYHRKHTRVTHCPHHQELEKLHSQQLFTRIVSSKISCWDFHCIFRIHCRTTWELTLQEVWGLYHCHFITLPVQQPPCSHRAQKQRKMHLLKCRVGFEGDTTNTQHCSHLKICIPKKKITF